MSLPPGSGGTVAAAQTLGQPKKSGQDGDDTFNTTGFLTPMLPDRDRVSYAFVLWNEFLGTLMYALAGRLFVGFFGGSTLAATIPILFGTAFANGFAYFGAMAVFGAVSGGHFNPAVTLAVLLIELLARSGWFGAFRWGSGTSSPRPWRSWFGLLPYFVVQFAAFLIAALLIWAFLPGSPRNAPIALGIPIVSGVVSDGKTFGVEIVGSFMFLSAYVLLLKMFGGDRSWLSQAIRALAFGFWYFTLVLVFAPWAGAVWNPGLWLGFAIVSGRYVDWWILLFPALISAVVACIFCLLHWWLAHMAIMDEAVAVSDYGWRMFTGGRARVPQRRRRRF